jgi:maltooligosyltrehalose trehalohydrolase
VEFDSGELCERRALLPEERGYFSAEFSNVGPGFRYRYVLDGRTRLADPASRYQPEGVHGPSQVVGSEFPWDDASWPGLDFKTLVTYELHVGSFSSKGNFDGVIEKLPYLRDLGITALEIMPIAQFPGHANWGYDGVFPFAAQNTYGGPENFKRLVNAAHQHRLGVVLDVVYNHLGPEGNVLPSYGPYFQSRYKTPWGDALNFDGPGSDELRCYFVQNALQWLDEFHVDALRLDAIHAICDLSARPFLEELSNVKAELSVRTGRPRYLIAETDMNDARILQPSFRGGLGLDAHWNDDFHHALHSLLTGEEQGYYKGYRDLAKLARIYERGVLYEGQYHPSRRCSHGRPYGEISRDRLVVCTQNHDQVGNRMKGERLASLVSPEKLELAAAAMFLSPFSPLLFMGEEFGETHPFLYFIDHEDKALVEAVRKGRRQEFASFGWKETPPDPASPQSVESSRLDWKGSFEKKGSARLRACYRELIGISKWLRARDFSQAGAFRARTEKDTLFLDGENRRASLFWAQLSFDENTTKLELPLWWSKASWKCHSSGTGSQELRPFGFVAAGIEGLDS